MREDETPSGDQRAPHDKAGVADDIGRPSNAAQMPDACAVADTGAAASSGPADGDSTSLAKRDTTGASRGGFPRRARKGKGKSEQRALAELLGPPAVPTPAQLEFDGARRREAPSG